MRSILYGFAGATIMAIIFAVVGSFAWLLVKAAPWAEAHLGLPEWGWLALNVWVLWGVVFSAFARSRIR